MAAGLRYHFPYLRQIRQDPGALIIIGLDLCDDGILYVVTQI